MPVGKIKDRNNQKNQNFESVEDDIVRQAANQIGDKINSRERLEVWMWYNDPTRAKIVKEHKKQLQQKPKTIRQSISMPGPVYRFLDAYFQPEYGDNWIENKKLWKHQLIKPWRV